MDTDEGKAGNTNRKATESVAGTSEGATILGGNIGDDNKTQSC